MRTGPLAAAGLALAVLAEACSVGLLGLSGWFIASSAVAGATAYSAFSYLDPSGGVRAFALGRIATGYANRVVLHAAALRRVTATRLGVYDRAASAGRVGWSGQSLDRVLADADTTGMALIRVTAPTVVAAAMTSGGCLVVLAAGCPLAALALAGGTTAGVVLAVAATRRSHDPGRTRAALRVELLGAVDAWPELASMGAADQLVARTLGRVAVFERRAQRQQAGIARARGLARAVTAVTLLLVVLLAARTGAAAPTLVMVALVAAGVLATSERLVVAGEAWAERQQVRARLAAADEQRQRDPHDAPDLRIRYDRRGLTVAGYRLPETPTRRAREVELAVSRGSTLVVHGASGSGKTTLLAAVAATLATPDTAPKVVLVRAEDHLFTGTVAGNIRLADPDASDTEVIGLLEALALGPAGLEPSTSVGVGGRDLSGGEQRRLHLARAIAARPDVLLVDEPTTALDPVTAGQVLTALRRGLPHAVLVLAMHVAPGGSLPDPTWSTISLD